MTKPIRISDAVRADAPFVPVVDAFSDDRAPGTVIGSCGAGGTPRLGCDAEHQIAIDHGALRFQPLISPGWGRQGLAYGPFRRASGLALAVSITNGHNTSQGGRIPDGFARRLRRWVVGPDIDPWPKRMAAWAMGPRRKRSLRRFLWWLRSSRRTPPLPECNENLALGWFTSAAPSNPLADGSGFVIHAAEGENGDLWVRVGRRCLSAFRRLKNLRVCYMAVLRDRGAIYYAGAMPGAHGLAGLPMLRPIAVDPFNSDDTLYAGIHQCVLGQIGFRVDTRVHGVHIERLPEFVPWLGMAHAGDSLVGEGALEGRAEAGGVWRVLRGDPARGQDGAQAGESEALALLDPKAPSGLVHALIEIETRAGAAGLAFRAVGEDDYWLFRAGGEGCALVRAERGVETVLAHDREHRLDPGTPHSVQVLDYRGQLGCYLDGERLFGDGIELPSSDEATGVGIWLRGPRGQAKLRLFEAHPREIPMPASLSFEAPWRRLGKTTEAADDFVGPAGTLAGRAPGASTECWERTLGAGVIEIGGANSARVRASLEEPNPGRTFYTLPWRHPSFADLEATIVPPGTARGQRHSCRAGLLFWQDNDNYLSFTVYLDDDYQGASIALFTKRHGFEELYDAIWTMVADQITWGKPFRLRVACDGEHFLVFVDDEPVLERALTDLYPEDAPLKIRRVGLAVNWEWGNDSGTRFTSFTARR